MTSQKLCRLVSFDVRPHPDRDHAVGILDRLALLDLVDHIHTGQDLADDGVLAVEKSTVRIHDEELAGGGVVAVALAGHADDTALEGHLGEFRLQVGIFRVAGAVAVLAIAGLRHEAWDHPVERHIVIELVAGERLEAGGTLPSRRPRTMMVAPTRRAVETARSSKVMQVNSQPASRTMTPQVSSSIATRSSAENSGALPGWTPMAITSRPTSLAAWRTTSTWPLVTGSNEPG